MNCKLLSGSREAQLRYCSISWFYLSSSSPSSAFQMKKIEFEQKKISGEVKGGSLRRWEDLDPHILKKLFSFTDLPGNVIRVCQSWRLCCWDILFWEHNEIDLSPIMAALENLDSFSVISFKLRDVIPENVQLLDGFKDIDNELMRLLESIFSGKDAFGISLEHWRLSIKSILIPQCLEISDHHLPYIAERTPRLESLTLLGTSRITSGGFANAVCNWKHVKHIILGHIFCNQSFICILEEIGKVCHELRTLKVSGRVRLQAIIAYGVSQNMEDRERQKFEVAFLLREVMNIFLSNCPKMEKILFNDCFIDYEFTDLLEWSRLVFTIKFDERAKDRRWHFAAGSKDIEQATESYLLKEFKLWKDEQPPWMELHWWAIVKQIS